MRILTVIATCTLWVSASLLSVLESNAGGIFGDIIDLSKQYKNVIKSITENADGKKDIEAISRSNLNDQKLEAIELTLMEVSAPFPFSVRSGETFEDVIGRACPGAGSGYRNNYKRFTKKFNSNIAPAIIDLNLPISQEEVVIPFCAGSLAEKYTVEKDDTGWLFFKEQENIKHGVSDWESYQKEYMRLNAKEPGILSPGEDIYIPTNRLEVRITGDKLNILNETLGKIDLNPLNFNSLKDPGWGKLQQIYKPNNSITGKCQSSTEVASRRHAEDLYTGVSRALNLNSKLRYNKRWERNKSQGVTAILDSGIDGIQHPFMNNLKRKFGRGSTSTNYERDIQKIKSTDPFKDHGMAVTSVAIGGHILGSFNSINNLVLTAPYRIHERQCPIDTTQGSAECPILAIGNRVLRALKEANRRNSPIQIVNVSSAHPKLEGFDDFVDPEGNFLVVTAAGNELGKIGDGNKNVYPAMFGGTDVSNVITVGAVDANNNYLASSNYNNKRVDIASWGCDVPVKKFDPKTNSFNVAYASGTSFAAPQVSFAAAMIHREQKETEAKTPSQSKKTTDDFLRHHSRALVEN